MPLQAIVANMERAGLLERSIDRSHRSIVRSQLTKKVVKTPRKARARVAEIEAITFGRSHGRDREPCHSAQRCAGALDPVKAPADKPTRRRHSSQ